MLAAIFASIIVINSTIIGLPFSETSIDLNFEILEKSLCEFWSLEDLKSLTYDRSVVELPRKQEQ